MSTRVCIMLAGLCLWNCVPVLAQPSDSASGQSGVDNTGNASAGAPPENEWVNFADFAANTVHANDFSFFEEIDELVQEEPIDPFLLEILALYRVRRRPRIVASVCENIFPPPTSRVERIARRALWPRLDELIAVASASVDGIRAAGMPESVAATTLVAGGLAPPEHVEPLPLLFDSVGHWLIEVYGLGGKVDAFRASYAEWGAVIILLKGLTPIPYKLVTITSGFAGYNIGLFILCSIVARGGRFFIVAILLNRYGDWIRVRIEKHLGLVVAIGAAVLVLGFVVAIKLI